MLAKTVGVKLLAIMQMLIATIMKLCGNVYVCNHAETGLILQVMLKPDILSTTSLRCRISKIIHAPLVC